jgi:hypothetical protein
VTPVEYILAVLVGTLSAARITRLLTWDKFPPTVYLRAFWDRVTNDGPYALLFHCPWCMSFWVTGAVAAWGYFTEFNEAWWYVNAVFGFSYVAAWFVLHDGDDD